MGSANRLTEYYAVLRDDLTDGLVLLRQLGPRGPEDDEFTRVCRHLAAQIEQLDRLTPGFPRHDEEPPGA